MIRKYLLICHSLHAMKKCIPACSGKMFRDARQWNLFEILIRNISEVTVRPECKLINANSFVSDFILVNSHWSSRVTSKIIKTMAHLLHDVYNWYRDLMDNRSGEWGRSISQNGNVANYRFFFLFRPSSERLAYDAITAAYFSTLYILCILL